MSFEVTDIVALIKSPDWPPDHWRVLRPHHRMRQHGITARYYWGDDDQFIPTDPERTVLVIPRQTGSDPETIDRWLDERRPIARAIIYDIDDDIFSDQMLDHLQLADFMQGATPEQIIHEAAMARYFASRCDGVTTSSEPLSALVRTFVDRPVITVPNALDVRWFRAQMAYTPGWSEYLTIGWAGGRRPERDVVPMAQAWGRIARRYPHVRFVACAPVIPDVIYQEVEDDSRIIRIPWASLHDYPMVYQTDIGCCSVADTPFSRAKTPIKCWEYAVAGAAVVATPTLYGDCVIEGHTGVQAEDADEWEESLSYLIERREDRVEYQQDLLGHVEQHHSLDTQLHTYTDAYSAIVESMAGVLA